MTRLELIKILVGQARSNGFEFRRWFTARLTHPWHNADAAFELLEAHRQYYALLFSHEFARSFWKAGEPITFQMPPKTFQRIMADGSIGKVERRSFTRRSARPDAWRYHLREMALADEPLRYMRKYLRVEEELTDLQLEDGAKAPSPSRKAAPKPVPATLALARKAHERRQLAAAALPQPAREESRARKPRLPGSRPKA
jgi:hypothetical protein